MAQWTNVQPLPITVGGGSASRTAGLQAAPALHSPGMEEGECFPIAVEREDQEDRRRQIADRRSERARSNGRFRPNGRAPCF